MRLLTRFLGPAFTVGALSLAPLVAWAAVDLLKMPAPPSVHATRSLLLDLERVGTDLYAVGEFGQVLTSRDNGGSWQTAQVPVAVTLTAISFADQLHGYAVGHDGVILKTEDQGDTWIKILDGNQLNEFAVQAARDRVRALEERLAQVPESDEETLDDVSYRLEDAQFLLDTALGDVDVGPSKPLLDVLASRNGLIIAAGAYGQVLKSTDEGRSWTYLAGRLTNPEGYHLNTLMRSAEGDWYVAGEQGRVFVSSDDGETWRNISIAYDGSIFNLVQVPDTGSIIALGLRGNVFKLPKGSDDWRVVETDLAETLSSATVLEDGSVVLVGARGILARSSDDFDTLQVARRPDKLPSAGVVQLARDQLLVAGMRGLRQLPLNVFE